MSLVATTKPKLGNLVKYEFLKEHGWCRETLTVNESAQTDLSVGSLVGKVTATGKYKLVDPTAVDGSQVVAGIVLENKTVAAATDTEVTVMVRGQAILANKAIVYDKTFDAGQKTAALAEIAALNILVRTSV